MIDINWTPDRRFLRQFSALLIVFFGLIGAVQFFGRGATTAGMVLWTIGLAVGGLGLAMPAFARYVYLGWMCALYPLAWLVSHTVLVLIYYLLLTPIGLVMRLCGRDPLQRKFDREASTYWQRRPDPEPGAERYFRQF
ncbi:MAG TPA: SxtJ family membrane protein [Planctomycetaceae bacterium]|nr:SxtJ family membrane protein [Planctomycetaceae bacterium]